MSGGGGAWMTGLNDRMTNSTNRSSGWCMSVIGEGGGGGGEGRRGGEGGSVKQSYLVNGGGGGGGGAREVRGVGRRSLEKSKDPSLAWEKKTKIDFNQF